MPHRADVCCAIASSSMPPPVFPPRGLACRASLEVWHVEHLYIHTYSTCHTALGNGVHIIRNNFVSRGKLLICEGHMTDRQPYPKDRDVLSNIMVKNMVLHAGWQIVILFTLIFGVGEVCSRDGQTCSPAALSNFKFMGTKPFAIPSGIFELVNIMSYSHPYATQICIAIFVHK